jgi:hypothetical protein
MKTVHTLLLLSLASTSSALGATPVNHAPKATITADSEHDIRFKAQFVADGIIPEQGKQDGAGKEWAVLGTTHKNGATLTMKWKNPVDITELIYYGRTSYVVEGWKNYEIFAGTSAAAIVKGACATGNMVYTFQWFRRQAGAPGAQRKGLLLDTNVSISGEVGGGGPWFAHACRTSPTPSGRTTPRDTDHPRRSSPPVARPTLPPRTRPGASKRTSHPAARDAVTFGYRPENASLEGTLTLLYHARSQAH